MVLGIGENKNLKFVVIGPLKTGKTTVVNYLADDSDNLGKDKQQYVPTLGLRYVDIICTCHRINSTCCMQVSGISVIFFPIENIYLIRENGYICMYACKRHGLFYCMCVCIHKKPTHYIHIEQR